MPRTQRCWCLVCVLAFTGVTAAAPARQAAAPAPAQHNTVPSSKPPPPPAAQAASSSAQLASATARPAAAPVAGAHTPPRQQAPTPSPAAQGNATAKPAVRQTPKPVVRSPTTQPLPRLRLPLDSKPPTAPPKPAATSTLNQTRPASTTVRSSASMWRFFWSAVLASHTFLPAAYQQMHHHSGGF